MGENIIARLVTTAIEVTVMTALIYTVFNLFVLPNFGIAKITLSQSLDILIVFLTFGCMEKYLTRGDK